MATVTFYELSAYNNAILLPFQVDLDGCYDHEDYLAAIADELLRLHDEAVDGKIPAIKPEDALTYYTFEEWIVADTEGVPDEYVGEWGISEDYWDYAAAVEEHGEDVVNAALECGVPLDKIEDAYCGDHSESMRANTDDIVLGNYAYQLAEECGDLVDLPDYIASHIDWESVGRNLGYDGYCQHNGHVFHNVY